MSTFQEALYDHLQNDAALMSVIVGIYDNPQQVEDPENDAAFPFLTIGEDILKPWDTCTEEGSEIEAGVHVWSRAGHFLECKNIQKLIKKALHRKQIFMTGFHFVGCDLIQQDAQKDEDGVTVHGVQKFKFIYQEV